MASSEVNSYNIDNSKRIFPPQGMIDRASAEISKCIMRLKRKDAKKPPEVPPKPNLNNSGNNGHNHHNQQHHFGLLENGGSSNGSGQWKHHGAIAVLPQHITTLSGSATLGASGSLSSTPQTPRKFSTLQKKTPTRHHKRVLSNPSQLWTDEDFLKILFSKYFSGSEKLVLPMICRKWRDVTYGLGRGFWGELIPVLKCKELRGLRPDLNAGVRRRFYGGLVKRG